jgi:plastocyanin
MEECMSRPKTLRSIAIGLALTTTLALQTAGIDAQIPADAVVQFGSSHPQPAPPGNHVLEPDEVTILKGGTVTFQVNGGGHGVAIYPVSAHTTRADIEEDLCPGGPGAQCVGPAAVVTDRKGDLIIDTGVAPARVLGAISGSGVFLNGSTNPAVPPPPPPAPGVRLQYRFEKTGRFLVICMNRSHSINDYMFGFVNVVGDSSS